MKESGEVYKKVVDITHVYFGPAADRFIARQVENHLHKPPSELTREDLKGLIDWIKVVVSLLTPNEELVEEYLKALKKLSEESKPKKQK